MSKLEDYANKYQCVRFERRDGILQMTCTPMAGRCAGGLGRMANCPRRFTTSAPTATTGSSS